MLYRGRDISTKILPKSDIKFFLNVILILLRKEGIRAKKTNFKIKFQDVKKALRLRNFLDRTRKTPLLKHRDSIEIDTGKLNKQAMLIKMSKHIERVIKKNMAIEQEIKKIAPFTKNLKTFR